MTYGIKVTAGNNILQVDSENADIYGIGTKGTVGYNGYIPATATDLIFLRFNPNTNGRVIYNLTHYNPNMGGTGKGGYKVMAYPTPEAAYHAHYGSGYGINSSDANQSVASGYDYVVYTNNPQNINEAQKYGLQIRDSNNAVKFDTRAFSSFALYIKKFWTPGITYTFSGEGADHPPSYNARICDLGEWISANWMLDYITGSTNTWYVAHWLDVAKNYTGHGYSGSRSGYYAGAWAAGDFGDYIINAQPMAFWRMVMLADIPA